MFSHVSHLFIIPWDYCLC